MSRIAFKMKLNPGFESEYKRRHDSIWPELQRLLKNSGIFHYSIFLEKETGSLFAYMENDDPGRMKDLAAQEIMKKWWLFMKDIMETNPDNSPVAVDLKEIFFME
jgi:L-rhamnose mutarotase